SSILVLTFYLQAKVTRMRRAVFKRHLQNPLRLDRPEPFFDGPVFLQRSSDRRTGNGVCERICDEDIGTGVSYVKRFLSSKKSQKQTMHSVSGFSYF
ncbi:MULTISPECIES: hypothetical protein, partial [Lachnospiraceae]